MKFSIGIPAYKAKYIQECINSILAQSYSDFELIIVNDASPEDIDGIVNTFTDSRIRFFTNEQNYGAERVIENWNKCLSLARGEYFLLMGDDDVLAPTYLETFYKVINCHPNYNVFHCQTIIIDSNGIKIQYSKPLAEFESLLEMICNRVINNRIQFISDFVYNTNEIKRLGGFFDLPLAQMSDDITAYLLCDTKGIANVQDYLFYYRQHGRTISSTGNEYLILNSISKGQNWINIKIKNIAKSERYFYIMFVFKFKIWFSFHRKKLEVVNREINSSGVLSFSNLKSLKKTGVISYIEIIHIYEMYFKSLLSKSLKKFIL